MFESILSSFLQKFLGQYVEGLDINSLNISVWSGNIDLENLELKSSAFDAFDLPITVVRGFNIIFFEFDKKELLIWNQITKNYKFLI